MSIRTHTIPWHEGEQAVHHLLKAPSSDNPTSSFLTPSGAYMLQTAPLLALGTVDSEGRPWTTLWGGVDGISRQIAPSIIGVRTTVDICHDPVAQILFDGKVDGSVIDESSDSRKLVAGLTIDLETRRRVKLMGRMLAGSLSPGGQNVQDQGASIGEAQLVVKIDESLGNCPKYLNQKHISPSSPSPSLLSSSRQLPQQALDLISKADMFFVSSVNPGFDMDCNHRGGNPGFMRVLDNFIDGAVLIWPEYSGNRLYQTLGNLQRSPKAGLVVPDFETGDVLYATGETKILVGEEAAAALPRSNLAVQFHVIDSRFVRNGLSFRGTALEPSPYNPSIRYLRTEQTDPATTVSSNQTSIATLLSKIRITPSIYRYKFRLSPAPSKPWKPGQYIALSFSDELDLGYSHMRDNDPLSLNDDFVRTFTISSPPPVSPSHVESQGVNDRASKAVEIEGKDECEFEITIRRKGAVTSWLSLQNPAANISIPVLGIGGEFTIDDRLEGTSSPPSMTTKHATTPPTDPTDPPRIIHFIATGIGITPLLPFLPNLSQHHHRTTTPSSSPSSPHLNLFWSLSQQDLPLLTTLLATYPILQDPTITTIHLFMTSVSASEPQTHPHPHPVSNNIHIHNRRLTDQDLVPPFPSSDSRVSQKWHICTTPSLQTHLSTYLKDRGQTVISEAFNY